MKKLILACSLLLAATGAQAQGAGSNTNSRAASTGGTNDQHQQTNPTNTQRDNSSAAGKTGAVGTRNTRH
jgi:hypothetical protein